MASETPTRWCSEAPPQPPGQLAFAAGFYAAAGAIGLSFVPAFVSERRRGLLALSWLALMVASVSVVILARYFAGGGNFGD